MDVNLKNQNSQTDSKDSNVITKINNKKKPVDVEKKRAQEMKMMGQMVRIYCRGKHHQKKGLCPQCQELLDYAHLRTQKCPFMATKTFCSACKVHCYSPQMKENVREVMRYSGPRMLLCHPIPAIRHCIVTIREMRKKG